MREGGFAAPDEPLDAGGLRKLAAARLGIGTYDAVLASPARAAGQTASGLGLAAAADERLRDMAFGKWAGLRFEQVHAGDLAGLTAWLADPGRGAPGGESIQDVRDRLAGWIAEQEQRAQTVLAITHPMIVRAVLAATLDVPDAAVMRFDVAPLSVATLSYRGGWRLQALGCRAWRCEPDVMPLADRDDLS